MEAARVLTTLTANLRAHYHVKRHINTNISKTYCTLTLAFSKYFDFHRSSSFRGHFYGCHSTLVGHVDFAATSDFCGILKDDGK